jgi:two-component system sensor histidine kinase KdpD
VASQIDLRRREQSDQETFVTPDQVMVCLSSRGPNSEKLLRVGSRLAGRLNRNWYAVYVQTPSEAPSVIEAETQRLLSGTLTLAKQLGAIVFTYKGTDVVETILRFAREYRVGHIVIGTPGRIPKWKRLLGKRSVVERLVDESSDITLVVIDTREKKQEGPQHEYQVPHVPQEAARTHRTGHVRLSTFLSPRRIVRWEKPVSKDTVLRTLTEIAAADIGTERESEILDQIIGLEAESSTFLNEGAAFPHTRVDGIAVPVVALGIASQGLTNAIPEKPTELIFFILTPSHNPDLQVKILGLSNDLAKDSYWSKRLTTAKDAEEAYALLTEAESIIFKDRS